MRPAMLISPQRSKKQEGTRRIRRLERGEPFSEPPVDLCEMVERIEDTLVPCNFEAVVYMKEISEIGLKQLCRRHAIAVITQIRPMELR